MNEKLTTLAAQINGEIGMMATSCRTALAHAAKVGQLLNEAKAEVKATKGSWLKWIKKNCKFGNNTASNYVRLHDHWTTLQGEPNFDTLTVSEALSLLVEPSRTKRKKTTARATKTDGVRLTIRPKAGQSLDTILAVLRTMADVDVRGANADSHSVVTAA